ncbi:hypothetical protein ABT336_17520 [Micromonospora sp. NPDC000207]|uniref:hypothetical protein n=1 Tax=Micromonospora sp. NPDC000207 TaxID=3154246 RepID=UPI0033174C87
MSLEIISREHLDQPEECSPTEVVLSAWGPLSLADAGYLATSLRKAVTIAGRTHRPYWLKRPRPSWCIAEHADGDHIEDRLHLPDDWTPVLLSLHDPVRTAGESCAHQAYRPRQLEIDLEQHADAVEPVVKFVIEGATAVLRLTLDEAEQVRTAIGQVATTARNGDSQPTGGARSPASPAPVPERDGLGWVVFDQVLQDDGLTADQKISVLRGVVAEQLTRQGLSLPEQAAQLNCTEDQAADAVVDFATWSHAGYLLPPTTSTESPCPMWCDGTCLSTTASACTLDTSWPCTAKTSTPPTTPKS